MERRLCAIGGNRVSAGLRCLSPAWRGGPTVTGGCSRPGPGRGRAPLLCAASRRCPEPTSASRRQKPAFLLWPAGHGGRAQEPLHQPGAPLDGRGGERGGEGDKLRDLSLIYGAYEAMTSPAGPDPRDRVTRLAEGLREAAGGGADIYLDGFTDFTPQEGLVLRQLLGQARSVTVAPTRDKAEEDEGAGFFPWPGGPPGPSGWHRRGVTWEIERGGGGQGRNTGPSLWRAGSSPTGRPLMRSAPGTSFLQANTPTRRWSGLPRRSRAWCGRGGLLSGHRWSARSMEGYGAPVRPFRPGTGCPSSWRR